MIPVVFSWLKVQFWWWFLIAVLANLTLVISIIVNTLGTQAFWLLAIPAIILQTSLAFVMRIAIRLLNNATEGK